MSAAERWPALALVEALKGRTVIDASCDGEGIDDVRFRHEDDVISRIDATTFSDDELLIEAGLAGPQARLGVTSGDHELWPHDE